MDDKEVALELLKLYLQQHRERVELDQLVEAYLAILQAIRSGPSSAGLQEHEEMHPKDGGDDEALFDFKEPISLSDKEA